MEKGTISKSDIIQDLKVGETVIYHHSSRTKVKCKFIEYMDEGFTAKLEALDGKKKGLVFGAFMDTVARVNYK